MDFRIYLRRGDWLEDSASNKIGHEIKFKVTKNRTAPPMRTGAFTMYTDSDRKGQIDRSLEILNYALLHGIIKLKGRTYVIYGKKVVNKSKVLNYLNKEDKIVKKLEEELRRIYLIGDKKDENNDI